MRREKIDYGGLVESALRTVVREVLERLARGEVPDPHHFYITFKTHADGVVIPEYLRSRYPSEMTIVLQHQYWNLRVHEDGFSVTLSFNDRPENLAIPFSAIKVFADPGVEFGLQFTHGDEAVQADDNEAQPAEPAGEVLALPRASLHAVQNPPSGQAEDAKDDEDAAAGSAEVVTLDRFRKK